MTRPEQPQPYPGDLIAEPDGNSYRRTYRDVLGRPMSGTVTIAGNTRTRNGSTVTLPAPVTVPVGDDGVLEVSLPAGTYQLQAALRTVDGARVGDLDTITLTD